MTEFSICVAGLVAVCAIFVWLLPQPTPQHVRVELPGHRGCREIVVNEVYACPDGRVYKVGARGWQDIGPVTPVPVVPR